jgi:hypothetical protein
MSDDMKVLDGWENFYSIVGSAAGALIGLQFVVMTLIAQMPLKEGDARAVDAYTTPTVVHFGVVLLLSAVVCAPWQDIRPIAVLWGLLGVVGTVYVALVGRRLHSQSVYQPVFEDRLFHVWLPFTAYLILAASGWAVSFYPRPVRFLVGAVVLLLLYIGIHNAWDIITYHVFVKRQNEDRTDRNR